VLRGKTAKGRKDIVKKKLLLTTILTMGMGGVTAAWAQDAATPAAANDTVEEVVVTGFRSSLEKALNLKRDAIAVRDSIVAEDIGKFPEANVAEALQRIPGIYMTRDGASNEGQRIAIRGLGPEYTVTTLNGAPVHTTSSTNVGGSSRDFNYDVFASELFGRVDFYKTPLAELEEGGVGGVVDLQTPRPFDGAGGQVLRFNAVTSYNTASKKMDPNVFGLFSKTWNNWGFLIGVAHSTSVNMKSGFEATGGYNSNYLAGHPVPVDTKTPPTMRNGPFNMALDWADPRAAGMLGNRTAIDNAFLSRFYRYYGAENTRDRDGLVSSLQYKNDKLDVSFDTLLSHLQDSRDEFTFGLPIRNSATTNVAARPGTAGHNGLVPINVSIVDGNLLQGTFGNTSYLGESYYYNAETKFAYGGLNAKYQVNNSLRLTGQLAASDSRAFYDNKRIVSNLYGVTSTLDWGSDRVYPGLSAPGVDFTNPANFEDFSTAVDWNREVDKERVAKLVADWDYGLGDWKGHLKAGLSYVDTTKQKTKRNGTSIVQARLAAIGAAGLRTSMLHHVPLDNLVIGDNYPQQWATFSRDYVINVLDPVGAAMASPVDLSSSFTADEQVSTAFIQSDFSGQVLGRELRINAGVRYSQTDMTIDNFKKTGTGGAYQPNTEESSYDNTLPSVSFAYDVIPNLVWRGSWGKTITRASLSRIAAQTVIPNIYNTYATSGNPDLKPEVSTNWDTTAEWYFGRGGILSAGYFKKKLEDTTIAQRSVVPFSSLGLPDQSLAIIWQTQNGHVDPNLPIDVDTFINGGTVNLDGLEFAYQQSFDFLPAPWDGFGALASYTKVNSKSNDLKYRKQDGSFDMVNRIPKYSYSLTGYYEKGPLGARLTYNYKARNIIDTNPDGSDLERWHAGAGYLDGNVSYKINDALELRLDVLNLTNTLGFDYFEDVAGRYGNGKKTRLDYAKYDGRTIKFGVRGKF
jgi:iron complex outermembrane receptor protein